MNRAIYILIVLAALNLVVVLYGLSNQLTSESQIVYVPTTGNKSAPGSTAVSTVAVKLPDERLLRDMIQTVLREELAPYLQHTVATQPEKSEMVDPKEGTPENVQAMNQAMGVIDNALASGQWTNQSSMQLLLYVPQLTRAQRAQLQSKLSQMVNGQELSLQTGIPAF